MLAEHLANLTETLVRTTLLREYRRVGGPVLTEALVKRQGLLQELPADPLHAGLPGEPFVADARQHLVHGVPRLLEVLFRPLACLLGFRMRVLGPHLRRAGFLLGSPGRLVLMSGLV